MKVEFEKNDDPNVMARAEAADGTQIIVMTAPASSIDGENGPVIIPSFDDKVVIVVYSEEFVMALAPNKGDSMKEVGSKMNQFTKIVANGVVVGREFVSKNR